MQKSILKMELGDPKKMGLGTWYSIHILARYATSISKKKNFEYSVKVIVENMQCPKCRKHGLEYLDKYPPGRYGTFKNKEGTDISMFRWSWVFHNRVNVMLGKSIITLDQAYDMYAPPKGVCGPGCNEVEEVGNSPDRVDIPTNRYERNEDWPVTLVRKGGFKHARSS